MEIVIAIDEEPFERILDIDGTFYSGSSASMNYGGLPDPGEPPRFEIGSVEWHETDPLVSDPDADPGDPGLFYEEHEDAVHERAMENKSRSYEDRWGSHPDV